MSGVLCLGPATDLTLCTAVGGYSCMLFHDKPWTPCRGADVSTLSCFMQRSIRMVWVQTCHVHLFAAGGGADRAQEAGDYTRDQGYRAQDRAYRAGDNYPNTEQIRSEGRLLLPCGPHTVVVRVRYAPTKVG